ncbi:MAG TPA: glycosyltransferase [Anaerolineales bacterium]
MPLVILSTLALLLGLLILYWIHNQAQLDIVVQPACPLQPAPLISVCVPARNEAHNIRACAEAILLQDFPNFELIVVDDRSSDATPAILDDLAARDAHLKIVHGSDLPPGWVGKPHALHQAANAARGDWLCFVDADTLLAPSALGSALVAALESEADLFSMLTYQVTVSFWEKVVLPLVMTALSVGFSPRRVNDPTLPDAIANGQFILIKRSAYDAVGGHAQIRDQIVEDKALAEAVKSAGLKLILANGYLLARTRMYTSLPQMWEGWTKNIYLGLRDRPSMLILGVFGATLSAIAALILPLWAFFGVLWWLRDGSWLGTTVTLEALALWSYLLYLRARVGRAMGLSGWWALTATLGAAVFAAMMLSSAWKVLSGTGVTWKGRRYPNS